MQKEEIMKVHQKNKEERKQRRAMVDGPSNLNSIVDNKTQSTAFEVSDEQQAQAGYSKFLEMINSAPLEEEESDAGYQRLANGMGVNENKKSLKKQNEMIAQAEAAVAL